MHNDLPRTQLLTSFLYPIVDKINRMNGFVFDPLTLLSVEEFLLNMGVDRSEYLGHGGTAIVFSHPQNPTDRVIKIAKKISLHGFSYNPHIMKEKTDPLIDYILPIISIIYEDEHFFIYEQKRCSALDTNVNTLDPILFIRILSIWLALRKNNIFVYDIITKNFGSIGNRIYLFDYHDALTNVQIEDTIDKKILLITLLNYINILKNSSTFQNKSLMSIEWSHRDIEDANYGRDLFHPVLCDYLYNVHVGDIEETYHAMMRIRDHISDECNIQERLCRYQMGTIDRLGILTLDRSSRHKYESAVVGIQAADLDNSSPFTFLDAGCCIGLIGIKIIQDFPLSSGRMCNLDPDEILEAERLIDKLRIQRGSNQDSAGTLKVEHRNVLHIEDSFDITLYFSLIHHLLRLTNFENIIHLISKQTKKVAVIECPVGGDVLMAKVKEIGLENSDDDGRLEYSKRYSYLESISTICDGIKRFAPELNVSKIIKIEYDSEQLQRYVFILTK